MSAPAPGWLVRQLPVAMLQDDFTARFAAIFEDVADTIVHSTDNISRAADLSLTPEPLVHFLGSWIGAPADPEEGLHEVRERDWVRAQARALSARGTRTGLEELLAHLSGGYPVEIIDGGGVYRQDTCPEGERGWVQVRMPLPGRALPQDVLELIRAEVPIGVDVELLVVPTPDTPPESFTGLVPLPREPGSEPGSEPDLVAELGTLVPVAGGPYFWDGGTGDIYPHLTEPFEPVEPPMMDEAPEVPALGALRRLPGTGGRAVRPGRLCPVCGEPGDRAALLCVRCGSQMRPVAAAPAPVLSAEPEPEPWLWQDDDAWPEPEPRPWLTVVFALAGLLLGLLVLGFLLFG